MKFYYPLITITTCLGLGITGCGNRTASHSVTHPAKGGTAVIALPVQTSPNWFFPLVSLTADSIVNDQVDELMYKPLLRISAKDAINYHRSLASSVTVNSQGTRYVVKLHSKWHWSNGQPVTAQDVVFTYQLVNYPTLKGGAWIWTPPQLPEPLQALGFGFRIRPIRGC